MQCLSCPGSSNCLLPMLLAVYCSYGKCLFRRSGSVKYSSHEHIYFHMFFFGGKQSIWYWWMIPNCAVTGCTLSDFRLNQWCKKRYKVHKCVNSNPPCNCEPPCLSVSQLCNGKKHQKSRLLLCKLAKKAPFDQSTNQPKVCKLGPKLRI